MERSRRRRPPALEHPDKYPFIILLADTRGQASINAASVQHELRNNELILRDYGHLKYRKIDDPKPEPTLESDEDWSGYELRPRQRGAHSQPLPRADQKKSPADK